MTHVPLESPILRFIKGGIETSRPAPTEGASSTDGTRVGEAGASEPTTPFSLNDPRQGLEGLTGPTKGARVDQVHASRIHENVVAKRLMTEMLLAAALLASSESQDLPDGDFAPQADLPQRK